MAEAAPPPPYRTAVTSALSSALLAAVVVGTVDVVQTLVHAANVRPAQAVYFAGITLVLYLATATLVGLLEGVVAGAVRASHRPAGGGLLARLLRDRDLDRDVTGWLLAGLITAVPYALLVAALAMRLVAVPERKAVGALLLGGAAAAALPFFVLCAYPVFRVTRRVAVLVPRAGRLPRALLALALVALAGAGAVAWVVVTRLDWRALPLGAPLSAAGFAAAQLVIAALLRRPLRPALAGLLAGASLAAAAIAVVAAPVDERTASLLSVESGGGKALVAVARGFFDRDGDGYSTVLGGGDCDDENPDIHPGARDIPDNGIDENCLGGDAHKGTVVSAAPAPPTRGGPRWSGNFLIVLIDTVRADRLGVAGYRRDGRSLTPRIDALAKDSVRFTRAYAQAPNTPRSIPSIFTARLPSQVTWAAKWHNFPPLSEENVTMWEALRDAGLLTTGFASHFYFTPARGATQGFVEFNDDGALSIAESNTDIASPRVVPRAVARLRQLAAEKKRFAMFVHLFEPHSRYMEHPEYPIRGKGLEGLEEKYDYEIAFTDHWVGELLDGLSAAGLSDDTMIVVLSDHGEAFGKHRYAGERMYFHGQTLYDELLHVPLLFHARGLSPRTVDTPVMLIDLAPTLVDLAGAAAPPEFLGRSLAPALAGVPLLPRATTAELLPAPSWNHDHKMLIDEDGRSKIIYRISDSAFELYDVVADPDELHDLSSSRPELLARMKERIARWMESEL